MAQDVERTVEELPERLVVEVALSVLGDNDVEDLSQASTVIAERAGIPSDELEALAQAAGGDIGTIQGAAKLLLADIASSADGARTVSSAVEQAGTKQFVLSPSDLILLSLLISGMLSAYVAVRTGGKKSEDEQTEIQYDDKGQIKAIKRKSKIVYVDSQSGFGGLLKRLLPNRSAGAQSDSD